MLGISLQLETIFTHSPRTVNLRDQYNLEKLNVITDLTFYISLQLVVTGFIIPASQNT